MRTLLTSLAAIAAVFATKAAEPIAIEIWPEGAPDGYECNYESEFMEKTGIPPKPMLYVYPAENPNGTAVLAAPGGGYGNLAIRHEGHDFAQWYNDQGITYAVLLYRLPKQHDQAPLSDVHQAMRILKAGGALDSNKPLFTAPERIGVMGFSAGGHLASTAATHYSADTRPDFQILFYPVISMDRAITHNGTHNNLIGSKAAPEKEFLYSNELQVTADTPPAIIFHCTDDKTVPIENSLRYFGALANKGVLAEMHTYPVGAHGWGFNDSFPYKADWSAALQLFLQRVSQ